MKRPSIQPGILAIGTLRKEAVRQAQAELARARALVAEAEAALLETRAQLARQTEPERPHGRLTGAALHRASAYLARRQAEVEQLERRLEGRRSAFLGARRREQRAREALRQAHVAAQLIERHVDRKQLEQRRRAERRAEDADDDDRRLPS